MFRALFVISFAAAMSGCISTPDTKALITPFGVAGIHSFKPERDPNRMPPDAQRVARIAANQHACEADTSCVRNQ
jgi:hypothetical protein